MSKTVLINTFIAALFAATSLPVSAASDSAEKAIQAAESAIAEAKANNWIWRDTEKFLSEAKAAADKGDDAAAVKLADKARGQAEIAVKQYEHEENMDRSM